MKRARPYSPHALLLALLAPLASCATTGGVPAAPAGVVPESITVTSRSFEAGGPIPVDCTCDGKDRAPDLSWSSPPERTKAIVVLLEDPDAPNPPYTHWIVFDVRPETRSLASGADVSLAGGKLGVNDSNEARYHGPCPPRGAGHHYTVRVIALDQPLGLAEGASRAQVDGAMNGHVLGSGELHGTFVR